ncbi:ribosome biogenesis GTP-binding protein YihA/YsxC [Dyadobacter fanqingshengii]|uniref:Probable GTP-binding protein EngB n=1 Tax=Dyadobacter fanqingshengii TaxID=2906443 RepID=A0A9X1PEH1_9BACT|nr:ribosome biogenesis GTP-binding protein YihA/YsxC [Dyadobacter fanqingshengii]MCF0043614.1 ribosome biogenesis GTP-binding protein YihA/YsxC [Dyadobacter fanqingshengii]MCF2504037.1 ribosome biogenesis GTP-binding protein YihA/YsxC [Dyadobacter fanqingshengii]USJ34770.1 ribosome biogenesis GTP-binding protein YihA/YsxC [Dyadobacter fanqingshengii]
MKVQEARYVMSNSDYEKCPDPVLPEYAFIGRSNVGKSSLINMLTGKKSLAKTSQQPGKTQLINHYFINDSWYLVDLPGYGYAKVSKVEREKWEKMIGDYLHNRENLICTFVLIDIRHNALPVDLEFMAGLGEAGIPFHIIFTKADKLKPNQAVNRMEAYKSKLAEMWEEVPPMFITSAEKNEGREPILEAIETYNQSFERTK